MEGNVPDKDSLYKSATQECPIKIKCRRPNKILRHRDTEKTLQTGIILPLW
jgi:hypothetical protein